MRRAMLCTLLFCLALSGCGSGGSGTSTGTFAQAVTTSTSVASVLPSPTPPASPQTGATPSPAPTAMSSPTPTDVPSPSPVVTPSPSTTPLSSALAYYDDAWIGSSTGHITQYWTTTQTPHYIDPVDLQAIADTILTESDTAEAIYQTYAARLAADLTANGVPPLGEDGYRLAFCCFVAHELRTYGNDTGLAPLGTLLSNEHLECSTYGSLAIQLFARMAPNSRVRLFLLGWMSAAGSHAQVYATGCGPDGALQTNCVLDPQNGIVAAVSLADLRGHRIPLRGARDPYNNMYEWVQTRAVGDAPIHPPDQYLFYLFDATVERLLADPEGLASLPPALAFRDSRCHYEIGPGCPITPLIAYPGNDEIEGSWLLLPTGVGLGSEGDEGHPYVWVTDAEGRVYGTSWSGRDRAWAPCSRGVVTPDRHLVVRGTDGTLWTVALDSGDWSQIPGSSRAVKLAQAGDEVYTLDDSGAVRRGYPTDETVVSQGITSLLRGRSGTCVYMLDADGTVRAVSGSTAPQVIATEVASIVGGEAGRSTYLLTRDGEALVIDASGSTSALASGVTSLIPRGLNGSTVYLLDGAGTVFGVDSRPDAAPLVQVVAGVKSVMVGEDQRALYLLDPFGTLRRLDTADDSIKTASASTLGASVLSMSSSGNGNYLSLLLDGASGTYLARQIPGLLDPIW